MHLGWIPTITEPPDRAGSVTLNLGLHVLAFNYSTHAYLGRYLHAVTNMYTLLTKENTITCFVITFFVKLFFFCDSHLSLLNNDSIIHLKSRPHPYKTNREHAAGVALNAMPTFLGGPSVEMPWLTSAFLYLFNLMLPFVQILSRRAHPKTGI